MRRELNDMYETIENNKQRFDGFSKDRKRFEITLLVFILGGFVGVFVGIILIMKTYLVLAISGPIFLISFIIGANLNNIFDHKARRKIKKSENTIDKRQEMTSWNIVSTTTVNGTLTAATIEFTFDINGVNCHGRKKLKLKKYFKNPNYKDEVFLLNRLIELNPELEIDSDNIKKIGIKYTPDYPYECLITDSEEYVATLVILKSYI